MKLNPVRVKKSLVPAYVILTSVFYCSLAMAMGNKPENNEMPPSIHVKNIYSDQQCGLPQAQISWIPNQQEFQTLFAKLRQSYIDSQTRQPPSVDWATDAVILVAMGRKNTGGYALVPDNTSATVSNGVLKLSVQWREPKPGMIVTQALTSPCLLFQVPRGEYHRIEITDQAGVVRLQISLD
jgi:hypothetical protein